MGEIQRPGALYQQVAAEIRKAIAAGEFPPGAPLPSESQLIARYGVSRPTVRNAISALRTEGLIEVIHGKGSFVRALPAPSLVIDRSVARKAKSFVLGHAWETVEDPTVYRTEVTATTAPLLELAEGEALFGVDRLLTDPSTGTRALHRMLIPFAVAEEGEGRPLAEHPDMEPGQIYAALAAAGHSLAWTETVGARMPQPDERSALDIPEATPVVTSTRITRGTDDRPLVLEELRASGARAQFSYRITADTTRASGAARSS
ncbi:GntR family transcriptional regulator [Streptomyces sp. ET3-23]|uniref:GntR family transcriptional regulator n=1 Tax=Streptomyces sp. ET3-23 TaxID=2885643 RepID=UPI001D117128|nr:GntR family transcriptional regulator [Streptomyces sp. ET3-23]MCC2275752.1 GntR family transcriptional regulator [Streptomyces sp. ET3-23]